jgi:hypothetical protein
MHACVFAGKGLTMSVPLNTELKAATITTSAAPKDAKKHNFEFDSVFGQSSSQIDVFEVRAISCVCVLR